MLGNNDNVACNTLQQTATITIIKSFDTRTEIYARPSQMHSFWSRNSVAGRAFLCPKYDTKLSHEIVVFPLGVAYNRTRNEDASLFLKTVIARIVVLHFDDTGFILL